MRLINWIIDHSIYDLVLVFSTCGAIMKANYINKLKDVRNHNCPHLHHLQICNFSQ